MPIKKTSKTKKEPKTFVLDTNVILHDAESINMFQENNVIVPLTVIEELDQFKRGSQVINLNARQFARTLDSITGSALFNGGISMGKGRGKLRIAISKGISPAIRDVFIDDTPDHRVLSVAYEWQIKLKNKSQVILVTKDVNLRMKAKALGIIAEDYTTDRVKNIEELYSGKAIIENFDDDVLLSLFHPPYEVNPNKLLKKLNGEAFPNKYFILKNQFRSVLAQLNSTREKLTKIDKTTVYGITPRNAEQTFAVDALINPEIRLVSLTGKAGTGKTLLALAAALYVKKSYRQIFIARPIVPLSNKDIGFLPGDVESKLAPYMQPLWDNLKVIQDQFPEHDKQHTAIDAMVKDQKLVIEPLSYIRGRSLQRIFFIVDEAQNLTPHEIKTIITRAGEGSKIVFTGDVYQIDHPYLDGQSNGLSYLIDRFKGQKLYAHINLEKGERSELAELASNLL
ncbi:MAG: PhoH family protein [Ignavibacteriales bacterium]|jgi:PhoH-like ATPase|nr:PhoH family protein [Ignavibacterium sp.]MCZ2268720.1 PhoH family protein [Ignavibacteriales bacterium]MDX9711561.1 PhoH family protein [Ignavibacteriaceae bacterium]GIK22645.1 MAG: phosphate starvation protein PhoH [Ignavibacteriota bacterium]MDD5607330.1 PhoH family protein [Ignavibacterium sp.]